MPRGDSAKIDKTGLRREFAVPLNHFVHCLPASMYGVLLALLSFEVHELSGSLGHWRWGHFSPVRAPPARRRPVPLPVPPKEPLKPPIHGLVALPPASAAEHEPLAKRCCSWPRGPNPRPRRPGPGTLRSTTDFRRQSRRERRPRPSSLDTRPSTPLKPAPQLSRPELAASPTQPSLCRNRKQRNRLPLSRITLSVRLGDNCDDDDDEPQVRPGVLSAQSRTRPTDSNDLEPASLRIYEAANPQSPAPAHLRLPPERASPSRERDPHMQAEAGPRRRQHQR